MLEVGAVRAGADQLPGAGGRAAVRGDRRAAGADDLDRWRAEPRADGHGQADQAGRDAVAVAVEADQRARRHLALDADLGREGQLGQRAQALASGQLADGQRPALTRVGDLDAEAIEAGLRLARRADGGGAPP